MTSGAPRPLRILMTADAVGGVWTYVTTLMAAIPPSDASFTLAVMGPPPSAAAVAEIARLRHVTLCTKPFRLEWMPNGGDDADAAGAWLRELAESCEADLVHVNGYAAAASARFSCPVLMVAHSCVRSWWRAVHRTDAPPEWDDYSARVRDGLACASLIVAPTRAMASAIGREYDERRHIEIIPNGVRQTGFGGDVRGKRPFIFAAGRFWDAAKNLAALDDAAIGLPWPVFAAGRLDRGSSGDNSDDANHGDVEMPRRVRSVGVLDRASVHRWMANAAIFAHPARYEPFGLSPLEAARAGCALVLGNIRSLREIWDTAAMYVDPESPGSLRNALIRVCADPGLREHLARAAATRAKYYSDHRMASAYLACYRRLAGTATPTMTATTPAMAAAAHRL